MSEPVPQWLSLREGWRLIARPEHIERYEHKAVSDGRLFSAAAVTEQRRGRGQSFFDGSSLEKIETDYDAQLLTAIKQGDFVVEGKLIERDATGQWVADLSPPEFIRVAQSTLKELTRNDILRGEIEREEQKLTELRIALPAIYAVAAKAGKQHSPKITTQSAAKKPAMQHTPEIVDAVRPLLTDLGEPGQDIPWGRFMDAVYEKFPPGPSGNPMRGTSPKTIGRIVKSIKSGL